MMIINSDTMKRIKEHYNIVLNMGYETVGIFLQGSQNYRLSYENSDVDTKVIVLPKFEDFVLGKKPVSTTIELENKEHIDLKDIRLMFECFKKQNINFVEILFTEYKILNPKYEDHFNIVIKNNEMIARYNIYAAINCMSGMSMEKYKALEHPYEGLKAVLEKYHYDPKQLHHIIRLNEFIKRFLAGERYEECLISNQKDYLIEVKKGFHSLEEAREIAKKMCDETYTIKSNYMSSNANTINVNVDLIINQVLFEIMKYNFKSELMS